MVSVITSLLLLYCSSYYFSIVDEFSKYIWYFPLRLKFDVLFFLAFHKYVTNTFSSKIIAIQTDWGGEFRLLPKILQNLGISHCITCPYFHSQNGSVEQCHRHIVETRLFLLAQSFVPTKVWNDIFQTAVFLIN